MLPGLPEGRETGSPETGDLGCGVTRARAADEEELGQTGISDSRLLFYKEAVLSMPTPHPLVVNGSRNLTAC